VAAHSSSAVSPGRLHTSVQARQTSGATPRQLAYWVESGLVTPTVRAYASGSTHLWTDDQVAELSQIRRLLELGMSLQAIRRHSPEVRARLVDILTRGLTGASR